MNAEAQFDLGASIPSLTHLGPCCFLYVATASDHGVAQGFLGTFTNLITGDVYETSDDSTSPWEVFPTGQYLTQLNMLEACAISNASSDP